jgi:SOS-response transcriptional repressor LexA
MAMSEYGKRVQSAMDYADINQPSLAKIINIKQPSLSYMIRKAKKPSSTNAMIASACGVDVNWLATGRGTMISSENYDNGLEPIVENRSVVPVISWVQAGEANEAFDLTAPGVADEYIPSIGGGDRVYGLYVRGNSMTAPEGATPTFPEGYIIHVDPDQACKVNDFVIAKLVGEDMVTFKQLKQGDKPYLIPLNSDHKPIYDEFRVLGKVIGVSLKL